MAVECDLYSQIDQTQRQHCVGFMCLVHFFNKYDVCSINQIKPVYFSKMALMNSGSFTYLGINIYIFSR